MNINTYKYKIMWQLFSERDHATENDVFDFVKNEYDVSIDVFGDMIFFNEEQQTLFLLRWS